MTVAAAPARRAVVDLGADATILDAAQRIAAVDSQDVVLVVPAGAPLTRNALFLDVLRRRAGDRRVVLVSSEARARSLAGSVHLKAFSSLAALDRHELDATEHLSDARRAVLATMVRAVPRRGVSTGRALAVFMSLLTAAAILLAVVGPSATIILAATTTPLGPFEYDLRAGPNGGDIKANTLFDDKLTTKTTGTATGSRLDEAKATGKEQFSNLTTNDIRIPIGTLVQTTDSPPVRFLTTEEKILPRSSILPNVTIGTALINIQAVDPGPKGNVGPDKISRSASTEYLVTNPSPTTGGKSDTIPIVQQADFDKAVSQSDDDVRREAERRMAAWKESVKDVAVYGVVPKRTGVVTQPSEVVGKELTKDQPTFQITISLSATAYAVATDEPRKTAIDKLRLELPSGMELAEGSAVIDSVIPSSVAPDGVHWRVRASGQQSPHPNRPQITAALAGRGFDEVASVARRFGFEARTVTAWPSWWPRLPVLDSRITIEIAPAPSPP